VGVRLCGLPERGNACSMWQRACTGNKGAMASMFTIGSILLIAGITWFAGRANDKDRPTYDGAGDDRLLLLHIRQDMKLVAFFLAGVIAMLGVIADRVH
jgi:hypothetical protein